MALLYSCLNVIGLNGVITLFVIGLAAIVAAIAYTNGKRLMATWALAIFQYLYSLV